MNKRKEEHQENVFVGFMVLGGMGLLLGLMMGGAI